MRHEDRRLLEEVRKSAQLNKLWMPPGTRTQRSWPLCLTCGREVDAVELKNANSWSVELWARCHGQEDFFTIKFPFRIEGDPLSDDRANDNIKLAMNSFCPFDPTRPEK